MTVLGLHLLTQNMELGGKMSNKLKKNSKQKQIRKFVWQKNKPPARQVEGVNRKLYPVKNAPFMWANHSGRQIKNYSS